MKTTPPKPLSPIQSHLMCNPELKQATVPEGFTHRAAVYGWTQGRNFASGWTADGLPLTNGIVNVMGEPLPRAHWDSGIFACLGRNDEFCSSDLEGNWESMRKSCGGCCDMDEEQLDQAEVAGDFATHVCCHPCALCQEGREIRRRLPHPGFGAQPMLVMIPPGEQTMGRNGA
ncbi:cell number regulator 8-like [Rutidosis leptorrhynchoides]|uniref:cell number regulator 8-like n=1 Tax=Rutidosis leptorrhynchoides TaxID=125765 RepID=UPI003A99663E